MPKVAAKLKKALCEASRGVSLIICLSIIIKGYQLRVLSLRIVLVSYQVTLPTTKQAKNRPENAQICPKTVFLLPVRP